MSASLFFNSESSSFTQSSGSFSSFSNSFSCVSASSSPSVSFSPPCTSFSANSSSSSSSSSFSSSSCFSFNLSSQAFLSSPLPRTPTFNCSFISTFSSGAESIISKYNSDNESINYDTEEEYIKEEGSAKGKDNTSVSSTIFPSSFISVSPSSSTSFSPPYYYNSSIVYSSNAESKSQNIKEKLKHKEESNTLLQNSYNNDFREEEIFFFDNAQLNENSNDNYSNVKTKKLYDLCEEEEEQHKLFEEKEKSEKLFEEKKKSEKLFEEKKKSEKLFEEKKNSEFLLKEEKQNFFVIERAESTNENNSINNFLQKNNEEIKYNSLRKSNIISIIKEELFVENNTELNNNKSIFLNREVYIIAVLILSWYICSLIIIAINKILFNILDFDFPVFVTFLHFSFISLGLKFYLLCFGGGLNDFPCITLKRYLCFVLPVALCCSFEIALVNMSYNLVSISVITVIRSSIVVFTYLGALCCGLEKFSWKLLFIVLFIITSVFLSVSKMEFKSYVGLVYLGLSVLLTSLRWLLTHYQMSVFNPVQFMYLVQPLSAVILAIPALSIDVPNILESSILSDPPRFVCVVFLICVTTILAFCLTFSEYRLVGLTSSLTLCVSGIGKEIITILMSMIEFKENLRLEVWFGIVLSIIGVFSYSYIRYSNSKKIVKDLSTFNYVKNSDY